jgi:GH43 family beta-xylosidase
MRTTVTALAVVFVVALSGCSSSKPITFENPIVPVGQDPFMTQWHGHYLLIEERNDNEIWVRESPLDDLTGVASRGTSHRVWTAPTSGSHCTDIWAPELHRIGDHWYVYYSATTCNGDNAGHRNFVLESTTNNPLGSYRDAGQLGSSPSWAIDGTEFAWRGARYFAWSGWPDSKGSEQDLFIARMNSPTSLSSARVRIARPTLAWERHGAPIEEGPESVSHAGTMFLVYSASGSWTDDYRYGLLRLVGSNPLRASSWSKSAKPVFASANGVYGPGHGSFVKSPDGSEYWMIYHSAIAQGSGWDREIDAQSYTWNADGTPNFGMPVSDEQGIPVPSGQR